MKFVGFDTIEEIAAGLVVLGHVDAAAFVRLTLSKLDTREPQRVAPSVSSAPEPDLRTAADRDAFIRRMREYRHKGKPLDQWTREDFASYLHEVIRPGTVLTDEMVFIVGCYTGLHTPTDTGLPDLRYDDRGHLDDVVVPNVQLFRLEQMDKASWWMRLYMPDGNDYVFWIGTSGREIRITAEGEKRG